MYQYTLKWDTVDNEIKKGDKLRCTRDVTETYKEGKTYVSENDNCITDDTGDKCHDWSVVPNELNWWDCFIKVSGFCETGEIDHAKVSSSTWKADRDYFQSTQEEYGKNEMIPPPPNNGIPVLNSTEARIIEECNAIRDLLISKNRRYGDSALSMGSIFNMSPVISIKARIEDKLQRLKNLRPDDNEDVILDLLGYFILLRIAQKQEKF